MNQRAFGFGIVGILFCLVSFSTAAEVIKCIQKDGSTIYTDRADACEVKEVIKPPPKIDQAGAQNDLTALQKRLDKARESRTQKAQQQTLLAQEQGVKKRNCELARDKLARVSANPRVYGTDEQGNRVKLGEDVRQQRIADAQTDIGTWCK